MRGEVGFSVQRAPNLGEAPAPLLHPLAPSGPFAAPLPRAASSLE